jgi:subtilisin family serine protease
VYSSALEGFAARMTDKQLRRVLRDSSVKYVEPDAEVTIADKPTPGDRSRRAPVGGAAVGPHTLPPSGQTVQTGATWGLDRIDQPARPLNGIYRYTATGATVRAYILDTGIYAAHSQFGGRAWGGFTAIADGRGANDCHGHGTHVAGTIGGSIHGVAKGVQLVGVRVLGCNGSGTWAGIIAGIDYVTYNHNGPTVANMSLSGGFNQAVNDAVTRSIAEGVTYAVAASNDYGANACSYSPASTPDALTVGATDSADARAAFSNIGPCLDVWAPGVSITSTWPTSTTATNTISGTSMASPHVAGLAALFLQNNPYATPATVNAVIKGAAVGVVSNPGAGSTNLLARKWNGAIAGTGSSSYEPDGSYWYQATSGYIRAWLHGTTGTDPDLYLQRWNGSAWVDVAVSATTTPRERVVYLGAPGYYTLRMYGYSGGNTYDAWATHPA